VGAAPLLGLVAPEAVQNSQLSTNNSAKFTAGHRLSRTDGFDHVIHAEKIADKFYNIFFVCNGEKNARLGIVASKRILPGSTQRNHIKRLIREVFRQHSIKSQQVDLVVMLRDVSTQSSLGGDLNSLFTQVEEACASL